MAKPEPLPRLDPAEAIAFFRAKGWEIAFDWRDVWQEENLRAFTVAKAMSRDLLEDIRAAVDTALAEGQTLEQFSKDLAPRLFAKGWWGRKIMTDPQTGEERVVQLGSPARLRTIYETNLRTSYMAGRWQRIEQSKAVMPFIRYVSVMDGREREQHHAWHGTILPVDDPWWDTHFPPCGWGCRCDGQPVNRRMIERRNWKMEAPRTFPVRSYVNKRTGEITRVEQGIDPGWSYNVGKAPLDGMTPAPRTGGSMGELNAATFSEADYARVRGFFAAFGLADRAAAMKGKIWQDAAGWPVPISLGLLRGPTGRMAKLGAADLRALEPAARVLLQPDSIGWVWVRGEDGRLLLVRRYLSADGAVDMGAAFWRWSARAGQLKTGRLVWNSEEGALAAFDRQQPRHPKGSRDGGRFRSTGRATAAAALTGAVKADDVKPFASAILGMVSAGAISVAARSGIDIAGRGVVLDHSAARHILRRHGPKAQRRQGEDPMTATDLLSAHRLFNMAHRFTDEGVHRHGMTRIAAHVSAPNGKPVRLIVDRSKRSLRIVTMFYVA